MLVINITFRCDYLLTAPHCIYKILGGSDEQNKFKTKKL